MGGDGDPDNLVDDVLAAKRVAPRHLARHRRQRNVFALRAVLRIRLGPPQRRGFCRRREYDRRGKIQRPRFGDDRIDGSATMSGMIHRCHIMPSVLGMFVRT